MRMRIVDLLLHPIGVLTVQTEFEHHVPPKRAHREERSMRQGADARRPDTPRRHQ
jgi:hypothetical protein